MAVNLIVFAVTLMVAGFLFAWVCFPKLRRWIEAPKYRVLQWPNRFPEAARPEQKAGDIHEGGVGTISGDLLDK